MPTNQNDVDEAAKLIACLITCMDQWTIENISYVRDALYWLKKHDHADLWLRASVRDLMEKL